VTRFATPPRARERSDGGEPPEQEDVLIVSFVRIARPVAWVAVHADGDGYAVIACTSCDIVPGDDDAIGSATC
jgi:hypothetical protein